MLLSAEAEETITELLDAIQNGRDAGNIKRNCVSQERQNCFHWKKRAVD